MEKTEKTLDNYEDHTGKASVLNAAISGRFVFIPDNALRPFIMSGLGIARLEAETKVKINRTEKEYNVFKENVVGLSLSAGAGLEYEITQSLVAGVVTKLNYIGTYKKFKTNSLEGKTYPAKIESGTTFDVNLSLAYKFGK